MSREKLKYPTLMFFIIFCLKIFYIVIESNYNYDVLNTTTNALLSQDDIEALNITGHQISSLGITLLLVPFFYMIVKRLNGFMLYVTMILFCIGSYHGIYTGLNKIVDKVVESQHEKRHDAYYLNLFKYGILNNIFAYNSFVSSDEIQNNSLHIDSKIVLTNTFLALYADQKLIDKIKERGKERVADIYIQKNGKEKYEADFKKFQELSEKVSNSWAEYNKARKDLKTKLSAPKDEQNIKNAYKKMKDELLHKYKQYRQAYVKGRQRVEKETSLAKLRELKPSLEKYFRYQSYEKAQKKYREKMYKSFGHFVKPEKWLNENEEVSYSSMTKTIREEINRSVREKVGLKEGLGAKAFFNSDVVKVKVAQSLKKHDILIPYDFDYSYAQFKKYYQVMVSKKGNRAYEQFYARLKKKIGENDLKLDTNWKDFIYSNYMYTKIAKKSGLHKKEDIEAIQNVLFSKDLGKFKKEIYLPKAIKKVEEKMYTKEDFKRNKEVQKIGDDAIKLLYIPPMALSLSIIALLLNIVTVFGMIMVILNIKPKIVATLLKLLVLVVIVFAPMLSSKGKIENKMLSKSMTEEMQVYIKFLGWISYWEKLNISLQEKIYTKKKI